MTAGTIERLERMDRREFMRRYCLRELHNAAARRLTSEFSYLSDSAFHGGDCSGDHGLHVIAESRAILAAHEKTLLWLVSERRTLDDFNQFSADDEKHWN